MFWNRLFYERKIMNRYWIIHYVCIVLTLYHAFEKLSNRRSAGKKIVHLHKLLATFHVTACLLKAFAIHASLISSAWQSDKWVSPSQESDCSFSSVVIWQPLSLLSARKKPWVIRQYNCIQHNISDEQSDGRHSAAEISFRNVSSILYCLLRLDLQILCG